MSITRNLLKKIYFFVVAFIYAVLLIGTCSTLPAEEKTPEKHVIGIRYKAGFFSNFFGVLNNLAWCETHSKVPVVYWGLSLFPNPPLDAGDNDNIWEVFFDPVSNASYSNEDKIYCGYVDPNRGKVYQPNAPWTLTKKERNFIKTLIKKYIHVKPSVQKEVNDFYLQNMHGKYTVGIHLRGTDKWKEASPVPIERIIEEANKHKGAQFFVATDDEKLLNKAKEMLNGNVLYCDSARSENGSPVHYPKIKLGVFKDVLVEALLLSQCDYFIHTISNVSSAVLVLNSNLKSTLLHKKRGGKVEMMDFKRLRLIRKRNG